MKGPSQARPAQAASQLKDNMEKVVHFAGGQTGKL
jgi:hypothetical protein